MSAAPRSIRTPDRLPPICTPCSRDADGRRSRPRSRCARSGIRSVSARPSSSPPPPRARRRRSCTSSRATRAAPTWVSTPMGWSTASNPATVTSAPADNCRPPAPSAWVTPRRPAARSARPRDPEGAVAAGGDPGDRPVRARAGDQDAVAARCARRARRSSGCPGRRAAPGRRPPIRRSARSSNRTPELPFSRSPALLRSSVVRTSDPLLPAANPTRDARGSGSVSGVPRSLKVASVASSRPPAPTDTKGRPGPGGIGCPVAGSTEVTVTRCTASWPLPVWIDAASAAVGPPTSCTVGPAPAGPARPGDPVRPSRRAGASTGRATTHPAGADGGQLGEGRRHPAPGGPARAARRPRPRPRCPPAR